MKERKSSAPTFPDAEYVGRHLVIDKTEWVPGANPEPHLREDRQTTYPETYYRCLRCGAERLRKRDFPPKCDGLPEGDGGSEDSRPLESAPPQGENSAEHDVPTTFDVPGVGD